MRDQIANNWLFSSATFRNNLPEKVSYVVLNMVDLVLTLFAVSWGLQELNPVVAGMLQSTLLLVMVKAVIPIAVAWLVPGKWLLPAIAFSSLVLIWNIKELFLFFLS